MGKWAATTSLARGNLAFHTIAQAKSFYTSPIPLGVCLQRLRIFPGGPSPDHGWPVFKWSHPGVGSGVKVSPPKRNETLV